MKKIATERKMGLVLNKRTIAGLNNTEMIFLGGGDDNILAAGVEETTNTTLIPTCVTYDTTIETGITPGEIVDPAGVGAGLK